MWNSTDMPSAPRDSHHRLIRKTKRLEINTETGRHEDGM